MAPLKVVCLISGGKDSLFSILHCLKNGHEAIALANLHPPLAEDGDVVDDMDSYMYQTVGHAVIPLFEQALGLPLYRQPISGTHQNQAKCYDPRAAHEDETEALIPLLQRVKQDHPEVNAVSTGAILSDYQRTRVESIATRLGLTSLAYLWQWPNLPPHTQSSLLEDMAAVSQDSRIIKVASGGLDDSFLWKNVAEVQTIRRLEKAANRFGTPGDGAVLGEGGEYETVAVAGPASLWKGRILFHNEDSTVVPCGAGAAYLRLPKPWVEPIATSVTDISSLRTPPLLEDGFEVLLKDLQSSSVKEVPSHSIPNVTLSAFQNAIAMPSDHILLEGLTGDGSTPAHQTTVIMDRAIELLRGANHSVTDIAYTSIVLRDMADFASINAIYGSYFNTPNPPARVTIACAESLPADRVVMISLTSTKSQASDKRRALHVQSRSYWAPANIGPYSQAVSTPLENHSSDSAATNGFLVYIAGQIPLVPSTMELPALTGSETSTSFGMQTVLALQHLVRIGRVMQVRKWAAAIVFVTASSPEDAQIRSDIASQAWEGLRCQDASSQDEEASDVGSESFDIWDVKFGNAEPDHKHLSVSSLMIHDKPPLDETPPLYVIQVDALPRGASVEWVSYGLTAADHPRPRIAHMDHLLHVFKKQMINAIRR